MDLVYKTIFITLACVFCVYFTSYDDSIIHKDLRTVNSREYNMTLEKIRRLQDDETDTGSDDTDDEEEETGDATTTDDETEEDEEETAEERIPDRELMDKVCEDVSYTSMLQDLVNIVNSSNMTKNFTSNITDLINYVNTTYDNSGTVE